MYTTTTGVKVSPEALEKLFLKSTSSSLVLNDVARSVRRVGGELGASTDGTRAEFWVAMPEEADAATPTATPTRDTSTQEDTGAHGSTTERAGGREYVTGDLELWRRRSWDVYSRDGADQGETSARISVPRSSSEEDGATITRASKGRLSLENATLCSMQEIFEAASKEQHEVANNVSANGPRNEHVSGQHIGHSGAPVARGSGKSSPMTSSGSSGSSGIENVCNASACSLNMWVICYLKGTFCC